MTHRPPSEIARLSRYERAFWLFWCRKHDAEQEGRFWERMGRHLGTLWFRSDFGGDAKEGARPKNPDQSFYPLSVLISPNSISKQIKQDFDNSKTSVPGYIPERGEEIVDMGEMDVDEFKTFMGRLHAGFGST